MWERGWIYAFKLNEYTIRGKIDEKDMVIQENYMFHIMEQCRYFS